MDKKFIFTTSAESAEILLSIGFQLINETDGKWLFMNNDKLVFSNLDKVIYTDKLMF